MLVNPACDLKTFCDNSPKIRQSVLRKISALYLSLHEAQVERSDVDRYLSDTIKWLRNAFAACSHCLREPLRVNLILRQSDLESKHDYRKSCPCSILLLLMTPRPTRRRCSLELPLESLQPLRSLCSSVAGKHDKTDTAQPGR